MEPTLADLETIYRMEYHRFLRVAEAISGDPDLGADAVNEGSPVRSARANSSAAAARSRPGSGPASSTRRGTRAAGNERLWMSGRPPRSTKRPRSLRITKRCGSSSATCRSGSGSRFSSATTQTSTTERSPASSDEVGTVGATLNKAQAALRKRLVEVPR